MGILLGLTAAFSWGLADYFAAITSRQTGSFRVVLGFHLVAMVLLAGLLVVTGEGVSDVSTGDLAWLAFVGLLGGVSYLAFYRALAIGPISIVSPIVSAYAAVTVVCAVLIGGERLGGGETVAIVVVMLGVVLASSDLAQMRQLERIALLGILLALATAVVIGAFVYGVAYFSADYGWLVPIFLARGFSTLFIVAVSLRTGDWRFPDRSPRLLLMIALIADRRHARLRRLQLRRPPRGHLGGRDRSGALLRRSDRRRRPALARAPARDPVDGHRPGDRGARPARPGFLRARRGYPGSILRFERRRTVDASDIQALVSREVVDQNGKSVGYVETVFKDRETGQPEWLGVMTGTWRHHHPSSPPRSVEMVGATIAVPWSKEQVENAPEYEDPDRAISEELERDAYRHYGREPAVR